MIGDSTIDRREVDFYTRLADTWWDRQGPLWPLHKLNQLRVTYIRSRVCEHFGLDRLDRYPLKGLRVLDVGCGGGILSESMAALGATVTGIDVVEKNIRIASLHSAQSGYDIEYRYAAVSTLAEAREQFDVVLNMEVVEHVADVQAFMRDCARVTAPGGLMFVATINRTPKSWLFAIIGAEYILRWLPRGTHRWSMFRKPGELSRQLKSGRFMIKEQTGVAIDPFRRRFRLTPSLAVNYMLVAARHERA